MNGFNSAEPRDGDDALSKVRQPCQRDCLCGSFVAGSDQVEVRVDVPQLRCFATAAEIDGLLAALSDLAPSGAIRDRLAEDAMFPKFPKRRRPR